MRNARAALDTYRARFTPTGDIAEPYAMLAVTVVCGDDDEHASEMAAPIRLAVVRARTGKRLPVATVEEALAHRFTPEEQIIADEFLDGAIIGGPARVAQRLYELARITGAAELMLSSLLPTHEERVRSLERVSLAVGL
jgi:alkanesulfonate monooxygenase SsuD/methylene tetrahydromethanopterin reductase-like flavin-dependent oxidoreductase (luciferase family)